MGRTWFRAIHLFAIVAACTPRTPASPDPAHIVWSYDVKVTKDLDLEVDATLENARPDTPLRVYEDARPFLHSVETRDGGRHVHYRVHTAEAARKLDDVDVAYATDGVVYAPPSTWLMRPAGVPAIGRFRFHVTTAPGVVFATGVRRAAPESTYEADVSALEDVSFAAFGALSMHRLPNTEVDVAIARRGMRLSEPAILRWLEIEREAVRRYFDAGDRAVLFVTPGRSPSTGGKTLSDGGASVLLWLGTGIDEQNILEDWVAAHELCHVAMPQVPREHAWFAEGLATYVEPVARVRAGIISPEKFWEDLIVGLPDGLPKKDDQGLVGAQDRDRLYWGGAIYFFLADVAIREKTGGARSLDDALRGLKRAGATTEMHWPLNRVIDEADHATGTHVLAELYEEIAKKPYAPDLGSVFQKLGVRRSNGKVVFDASAPAASVRLGITAGLHAKNDVR